MSFSSAVILCTLLSLVLPALSLPTPSGTNDLLARSSSSSCFPALGFQMPDSVPDNNHGWWCSHHDEYAFLGFSYETTPCQSKSQLTKEFKDIRNNFNGRYVRIYGVCDRDGFYDDVVDAAWEAGVGVQTLIWFGFDGGNQWMKRRDDLIDTLLNNPKSKFVVSSVQFGSEPLFDSVLSPDQLATQVKYAKQKLSSLHIPITVSDLAYGFQSKGGAQDVLDAVDFHSVHILPYFSQRATTAANAWDIVVKDNLNFFIKNGRGKKMVLSQAGWPSTHYQGVMPNSPHAVSDVSNEKDFANLLDDNCEFFKQQAGGGVGWFWHIYSDYMEPGYGLYGQNGQPKFAFKPRTSC